MHELFVPVDDSKNILQQQATMEFDVQMLSASTMIWISCYTARRVPNIDAFPWGAWPQDAAVDTRK